jgi:cytochrome P450
MLTSWLAPYKTYVPQPMIRAAQHPKEMDMQTLAEMDLPYLPVEDPDFAANPTSYVAEARKKNSWIAKSDIGYFIHQYAAIRELLGQDDKLRPGYEGIVEYFGAHGSPWGRFTEEQMISLPAAQHRRLRDTFAAKFTPRYANRLRPMMQGTITRLLDEWAPRGKFDFEEMASYFPISNMFTLVGASVEEIPGIRASLETLGLAFSMDKSRLPAIHEAFARIEELVFRLIAERRAHPESGNPDDLLSLLIETSDEGGIAERQLADLLIFFFIAGYDTSKNVLTHTMYLLLQHPDMYERCDRDRDYCRLVLDEGLRFYNPGQVPRLPNEDLVFRDVIIPKDTMLWFTLSISGRDPGTFPDPENFEPERPSDPSKRHIAFSLGKHMCLGQFIARAQLQEALHQIPQRLRNPHVAGKFGWRPFPGTWGLKGLPIEFTPAPATAQAAA